MYNTPIKPNISHVMIIGSKVIWGHKGKDVIFNIIRFNVFECLKKRPRTKKELQRYLGMAGYYRKFCQNFSDVASPLTNLLAKNVKYVWSEETENGFNKIKAILISEPVLIAPDFQKQFKLAIDDSDIGCGGVLMQVGEDGIDHPISYFSKKFDKHQRNYSTIENECLVLILALEHFDVYLGTTVHPVLVSTDHNPPHLYPQDEKQKSEASEVEFDLAGI